MNLRAFRSGSGIPCEDIDVEEPLRLGKRSGVSRRSFDRWLPLLSLVIAACAPDAWRPDDRCDAFIAQVQNKCVFKQIGAFEISPSDMQPLDPFFLDVTSRFYHGQISRQDYVSSLEAAYTASPDAPGIVCILGLMTGNDSLTPPGM